MSPRPLALDRAVERRDDAQNTRTYRLDTDPRGARDVVRDIPVDEIVPSAFQHRHFFDPEKIAQLGASYGVDGLGQIQPITVRPRRDHAGYELVAGERRWRAAIAASLPTIKALVREMTDAEARVAAAAENLLREGLQDWETACAYVDLRTLVREGTGRENAGARLMLQVPGVTHAKSMIQNYLRVGERVPKKLLLEAGAATPDDATVLDPTVLRGLTITALTAIADEPNEEERLKRLRRSIAGVRAAAARAAKAATDGVRADVVGEVASASAQSLGSVDAVDVPLRRGAQRTFQELIEEGGWRKNLEAPFKGMSAADARRHLGDVAPVVAALASVEGQGQPIVRAIPVHGSPLLILTLPTAQAPGTLDDVAALRSLLAIERAVAEARRTLLRVEGLPRWLAARLSDRDCTEALSEELEKAEARAERAAFTPGQRALHYAFAAERNTLMHGMSQLRGLANTLSTSGPSAADPALPGQEQIHGELLEELRRVDGGVRTAFGDVGERAAAEAWSAALGAGDATAAVAALRAGVAAAERSLVTRMPARWERRKLEKAREARERAGRRSQLEIGLVATASALEATAAGRPASKVELMMREGRLGEETRVGWHAAVAQAGGAAAAGRDRGVFVSMRRPADAPETVELTLRLGAPGVRLSFSDLPLGSPVEGEHRFRLRMNQPTLSTVGRDMLAVLDQLVELLSSYRRSKARTQLAESIGLTTRGARELATFQSPLETMRGALRDLLDDAVAWNACDVRLQELAAEDVLPHDLNPPIQDLGVQVG